MARVLVFLALVAAVVASPWSDGGRAQAARSHDPAASATPPNPVADAGGLTAQPVLGFPATGATIIGASPADPDNSGEVWAEGDLGNASASLSGGPTVSNAEVLVRQTASSPTWQIVPVQDGQGDQLATGWAAAEATPDGAVVLAGITSPASAPADPEQLLVSAPDTTSFAASGSDGIPPGVTPSTTTSTPVLAADDETGQTGVFVAPTSESASDPVILHYTTGAGGSWQAEQICTGAGGGCTAPSGQLTIDAISASSASNVWMVATPAGGGGTASPQLYERQAGSAGQPAEWVQQPSVVPSAGGPWQLPSAGNGTQSGAILTASGGGAWLDLTTADGSQSATVFDPGSGGAPQTWCTAGAGCSGQIGTLPATLPAGYGSIVTTPASAGSPGARAITGLPHGAMMVLAPGATSFAYQVTIGGESEANGTVTADDAGGNTFGPGGETLAPALINPSRPALGGGAAFISPTDAWLGIGGPTPGPEVAHLTSSPSSSSLTTWPVPATAPFLAIAGQPGTDAAGGTGEAIAVGADGEAEMFQPGLGWVQEPLTDAAGQTQTPTLLGVAWPTAGTAYAVGDDGAMWIWRASSPTTWSPDPGAPAGEDNDLTAIAFSPSNPSVGYAVGKDGTILSYDNGSWQTETPPGLVGADFSSVTFAGGEAIAAYRLPPQGSSTTETGGLISNDGSGWEPVSDLPSGNAVLTDVAGLPDGGAVAAGPGIVIERNASGGAWQYSASPLGELAGGAVSALAAYRDSSNHIRAIVSVDPDPTEDPDVAGSPAQDADTANPVAPDPEPNQGFVVQETATGWVDAEDQDFPGINEPSPTPAIDQPGWPESIYALLVNQTGTEGWAVGGQTGGTAAQALESSSPALYSAAQDGAADRFGSGGPAPPVGTGPAFPTGVRNSENGQPLFGIIVGGGQGCNQACADDAQQLLGPDVDLAQTVSDLSEDGNETAFVDVGRAIGWDATNPASGDAYVRDLQQFDTILSSGGSGVQTYAVPNGPPDSGPPAGDIQTPTDEATYSQTLGSHDPTGTASVGPTPPQGTDAYAFVLGSGNLAARVIVLDFSQDNTIGTDPATGQLHWLSQELSQAVAAGQEPAVIGADDLTDPGVPNYAHDAIAVQRVLAAGQAAGYVYNSSNGDITQGEIDSGDNGVTTANGRPIPTLGAGTLGGGSPAGLSDTGSGAVVLAFSVGGSTPSGTMLPLGEIPITGSVAPSGDGQTTFQAGQAVNFPALEHRIQGGAEGVGTRASTLSIPPCVYNSDPTGCEITPDSSWTSTNPTVGEFVVPSGSDPGLPFVYDDKVSVQSGAGDLFCAFEPGTTTITLDVGGQTYSETITVTPRGSSPGPCPLSANDPVPGTTPAPTQTQPSPAPAPAPPQHRPTPAPTHRPALAPHHPAPQHHRPPVHHHSPRPAPAPAPHPAPAPAPAPPAAAPPAAPAPKAPPLSGAAPPQPVPPPGASTGAPANVSSNVPVSSPASAPFNAVAVQRRDSAEVQLEQARHHFAVYRAHRSHLAAYRAPQHSSLIAALTLLVLALGGGSTAGGAYALRRRHASRRAYARIRR